MKRWVWGLLVSVLVWGLWGDGLTGEGMCLVVGERMLLKGKADVRVQRTRRTVEVRLRCMAENLGEGGFMVW